MTNLPLISIITVSYNAISTIEKTICSVLAQTYSNIEYIIIDGGSTDGTVDIIKKYDDKLTYWVSEPDKGIYDAMNKGISYATGDLIGLINSDDWYADDVFQTIVKAYLISDRKTLLHGDIAYYKCGKITIYKPAMNLASFWYGTVVAHPTVFVPKCIYEEYGVFDRSYKIAADYDLLLRLFLQGVGYRYLSCVVTHMSDGGVSSVNMIAGYREVLRIALSAGIPPYKIYYAFYKKSLMAKLIYFKDALKCKKNCGKY